MTTIAMALAISSYMILSPAHWLKRLMQLTTVSGSFKATLFALGGCYLLVAWISENFVLPNLARAVGRAKLFILNKAKKRKEYKLILEATRM